MTRLILVLAACALMSACGEADPEPSSTASSEEVVSIPFRKDGTLTLSRDGVAYRTLDIEIAETDSSRNRGLMQRNSLPEDSGMLFIFDREEERGFWMANTPLALDLIFLREDGSILSISKYVQPMRTETVPSNGPAMYVLEVEAGYSDSIGIIEGDAMAFERLDATSAD
ncbi:MAG: DUF192 domain-containing protein [Bacteroidetes bacterium]|nr:DUF192 domain-containing protein [Bacteroidota bacterium]MDA0874556.1 DUF192 domain-containing protein [Bacteroidota bacterium]